MTIAFVCPNGHPLNAPEDLAGKPGKCPKCGMKFLIPTPEESAPETAEEPAAEEPPTEQEPTPEPHKSSGKLDVGAEKPQRFKELFVFLCPNGHRLNGPSSLKGKPGQCPHCGTKFLIPADDDVPPEETPEEVPTGEVVDENEESVNNTYQEEEESSEPQEESESEMPVVEVATTWQLPPPQLMGGHRLAELFTWLWAQREPRCVIELVMKDGETFTPKLFAPELSQQGYGVFATRDDMGKFIMTTISWENVAAVIMRNLDEIPHALFE